MASIDMAYISRLRSETRHVGTSIFIRLYDGSILVDEFECRNVSAGFSSHDLASLVEQQRQRVAMNLLSADSDTGAVNASFGVPCLLATDGNSLSAEAGAPVNPMASFTAPQTDVTWIPHALALTERRMRWVANPAFSGHTIAQRIAALPTWVPTTQANCLVFQEGTNSISIYVAAGQSPQAAAASALADLDTYLSIVRAYGKFQVIYLMTAMPRGIGSGVVDLAAASVRNLAHNIYNDGVRQRCASQQGLILCDAWATVVDPTSLNMLPKANYMRADNLHCTQLGARAVGTMMASVFNSRRLPNSAKQPTSNLSRAVGAGSLFMNSNPLMLGTPSAAGVSGGTGVCAPQTRVVTQGTITSSVASVVAAADGIGNANRVVVSGASAGSSVFIGCNATESQQYYTAADFLECMANLRATGMSNVQGIELHVTGVFGAQNRDVAGFFSQSSITTDASKFDQSDIIVPYTMFGPTWATVDGAAGALLQGYVKVLFFAGGAGTFEVSRLGFVNQGQSMQMY